MKSSAGVMRWLMACMLAGGSLTATGLFASDAPQFLIESELWIEGEPQEVPVMVIGLDEPGYLLQTNEEGRVEEGGWRTIERTAAGAGAAEGIQCREGVITVAHAVR